MKYELSDFVKESNRIEGIHRDPTRLELDAHLCLLSLSVVTVRALEHFVADCQPDAVLRTRVGMDVRVGNHIAPRGGLEIEEDLQALLGCAQGKLKGMPHAVHLIYEDLHPFTDGNGRSGRALWLWMMGGMERAPLGFLHHFYYQTLSASR